ncbi:helix-turn-helix domain-containing protein [Halomonas binhaiensis]|uniref:Helix-turn-helix transcriptional regulator n=1 Tax=Halomonas binhaiensis TaxID=2562282 RepID=A0A5C1NHL2_9GAMM|nr:AraC family transcriptional regulator [Halomonas binhaiensis]QEM81189.1 helix-turn-helix transcriptional regulator [Halomonas binhaiensis]
MIDAPSLPADASLNYRVDWSAHGSDHCVATGWRVLPHWVVLHILEGTYHCEWRDARQQGRVSATNGEVLLVPAGMRHALTFEPGTAADGLHITFNLYHSLDVFSFYRVPWVVLDAPGVDVADATRNLTALLETDQGIGVGILAARHTAAYHFLQQVLAVSSELPEREWRLFALGRLQSSLQLIEMRLERPPTIGQLAEHCALSRNRFGELFKMTLGVTPKQYIDQQRLNRAMSLLVHSDQAIAEIAARLGFCDPYHFSKRFKQLTGETPSRYRCQVRKSLALVLPVTR